MPVPARSEYPYSTPTGGCYSYVIGGAECLVESYSHVLRAARLVKLTRGDKERYRTYTVTERDVFFITHHLA